MGWVRAHFSEQRLVYGRTEGRLPCSNCHYFWKLRFCSPVSFVRTSSLPPSSPKKLPKTGYQEKENEVNCFNSPPHLYGVTFPIPVSNPSLPVWVWLCVCGLWEYVCEEGTTSIPGFFRVNYGPARTHPWDEYSLQLGEGIGRQGLNKT